MYIYVSFTVFHCLMPSDWWPFDWLLECSIPMHVQCDKNTNLTHFQNDQDAVIIVKVSLLSRGVILLGDGMQPF